MGPGHDVDVLFLEHGGEQGAFLRAPRLMIGVEEAADQ